MTQIFASMTDLHISVLEKIIRPVIVYFAIVILLRVFGKRQLAQLNPFDLTVLLCLSNTLQNAIIGDDNSVSGGIIGAVSLLAVNYAVVRFFFGHRNLDQIAAGKPTVMIEHGKLKHSALAKEPLTVSILEGTGPLRSGARRHILNVRQGTKFGVKALPGADPADGFAGTASKCSGPELKSA